MNTRLPKSTLFSTSDLVAMAIDYKQRRDYNDSHRVRPLDPLLLDTPVWIEQNGAKQLVTSSFQQIHPDPTFSLQMAKSLDNTLHSGHQYRHFPALEFQ